MKRSSLIRVGVSVTLLGVALLVLRSRLQEVEMSEVLLRLRELPTGRLVAAAVTLEHGQPFTQRHARLPDLSA